MAPFLSKSLTCFYCGKRSTRFNRPVHGPVRLFRCEHCEADNFFDEKGEITDPPAAVTNVEVPSPSASKSPIESADVNSPSIFCATCTRNQHLLTSSLASYFPASDDPSNSEYERKYEQVRQSLEERYPQVCESCEPIVKSRIRKVGYEVKTEHLRRMLDQSKANRASRQAKNWSWRGLLLFFGAFSYWSSILGQIAWNSLAMLTVTQTPEGFDENLSNTLPSCVSQTIHMRRIPAHCSLDLSPMAGLALVAGVLSLWWNPKLRLTIDGLPGKFGGLAEYYQAQLIVMVVRCVFWALLKDPSASGLESNLPQALHGLMLAFTILSALFARNRVTYSTSSLVNWSDNSWETRLESAKAPSSAQSQSPVSTRTPRSRGPPKANEEGPGPRFPIDKLAPARSATEQPPAVAPPREESDIMDWSPSITHNLRPTITKRDQPSVRNGPHPFHGQLPAAPTPPSWKLRSPVSPKPIEQVVQPNPFHRSPSQAPSQWQQKPSSDGPVFREATFFAPADHDTSTGLETLFDRAFNFKPDSAPGPSWDENTFAQGSAHLGEAQSCLFYGCLRLGLLVCFISAWTFSQNHQLFLPGNYVEIAALGVASLVAGFALISMVKRPFARWNGTEILISITELGAAVHMGAHLPTASVNRDYFDRYGKLLLIFMVLQEAMNVLSFYQVAQLESQQPPGPISPQPQSPTNLPGALDGPADRSFNNSTPTALSPVNSPPMHRSFESQPSAPSLSFGDTESISSFSSALPSVPQYGLASSRSMHSFPSVNQNSFQQNSSPHSFTMESLKQKEPLSDYEQDSDTDTVATTTTTATNFTNRNIRYGNNPGLGSSNPFFSPRRTGLGSGLGGLSLDDDMTPRRMTRSQTQQGLSRRPTSYVR